VMSRRAPRIMAKVLVAPRNRHKHVPSARPRCRLRKKLPLRHTTRGPIGSSVMTDATLSRSGLSGAKITRRALWRDLEGPLSFFYLVCHSGPCALVKPISRSVSVKRTNQLRSVRARASIRAKPADFVPDEPNTWMCFRSPRASSGCVFWGQPLRVMSQVHASRAARLSKSLGARLSHGFVVMALRDGSL
jgi:hypothetical protein